MAPKVSPEVEALSQRFQKLGLPADKSLATAKSSKAATSFTSFLDAHATSLPEDGLSSKQAGLLLHLSTAASSLDAQKQSIVVSGIVDTKLASPDQINAAVEYLSSHDDFNQAEFEKFAGVGVTVPLETCQSMAEDYVTANLESLRTTQWSGIGKTVGNLKSKPELRWANPLDVKTAVESAYTKAFGSKEAAMAAQKQAKAKPAPSAQPKASTSTANNDQSALNETTMFEEGWLTRLHKPGGNPQIKPELMKQHLEFTKGKVFTRFPPEPNGYMHIGHLKALVINFGYAKYHGGCCYLRYDDTNPEAEEQAYIDAILDMCHWLGFEPFQVTYASDHFQKLYDCAVELIKRGKAYVDHSTAEEMKIQRGGENRGPRVASKWRDRPIEESLAEFAAMQEGKYQPGEAVLRMKMDLEDPNPQMWDLVAYRILKKPHHRTGDKWKIYPTYDFTHCLNDSFENISHSLCTTEFILSRQSYEWLCDALEVYKARQSEYGRLNIQGTITSKRKIRELVEKKYVNGWDDPRLYTLIALKRRGVPPGALKAFISQLGVTTALTTLPLNRLEQTIRQYLEVTTPRMMLVLNPVKVIIENLPEDHVEMLTRPIHPRHPEQGMTKVPFTRTIYIDASDFREEDSDNFFRLAPGKAVGLLNVERPITCTSFTKDPATGAVTEIRARYDNDGPFKKPKAYIQWVTEHAASKSPIRIEEARMFAPLFLVDDPAGLKDYLKEINPNALTVHKGPVADIGFWDVVARGIEEMNKAKASLKPGSGNVFGYECIRFQGLRTAYFSLDSDSKLAVVEGTGKLGEFAPGDKVVLNTIVSLKEDAGKK